MKIRAICPPFIFICLLFAIICCGGGGSGVGTTNSTNGSTNSTTGGSQFGTLAVNFTWPSNVNNRVLSYCDVVKVICIPPSGAPITKILNRGDSATASFMNLAPGLYRATMAGYANSASTEPALAGATSQTNVVANETAATTLTAVCTAKTVQVSTDQGTIGNQIQFPIGYDVPFTFVAKNAAGQILPLPKDAFYMSTSASNIAVAQNLSLIHGAGIGTTSMQYFHNFGGTQQSFSVHVQGAGGDVTVK